jgi:hypothetical protein
MRVITEGAKEQLVSRMQCMRDVTAWLDAQLEELIDARIECCGSEKTVLFSNGSPVEYSDGENLEFTT